MLVSHRTTNASLPSQSFWGKSKNKNALARQRILILAYGDMETVRVLPQSFAELEAGARDWTKLPPDTVFSLRVPTEFVSLQASRLISGPYIYLTGEDSYQIAIMGVRGIRVEIVSDEPQ
ncbi:hypothetical protein BU15DRAFT_56798 [Melanogaster broomeanus]|nr:hypothetical protein BU15DRAFT_56798 [Melanogaster broomeanus]